MRIIEVVDYRDEWNDLFLKEKKLLEDHLNLEGLQIHHIGSTSVRGLKAKPIIDILIEVNRVKDADAQAAVFDELGYEVKNEYGIPGRRFYMKGGDQRTHHIHLFDHTHQLDIDRHLAVRDYLRCHQEACDQYAEVKMKAAEKCHNDNDVYCDLKNDFVKELEKTALDWYQDKKLSHIFNRRSVKKYRNEPVPKEMIDKIIQAGLYAPSSMNRQSAIIVALTNKEMRDQVAQMNAAMMKAKIDPFYGAPAVLIVLADKNNPCRVNDGSLVMANMMQAAADLGLGSCWIHRAKEVFETEEGKQLLKQWGIEEEVEGIANCIIGFPDLIPYAAPRKENRVYIVE